MVRKISILSDIAFNTFVDVNKVEHRGIKGVSKKIIEKLSKEGYALKFICEAKKVNKDASFVVEPVVLAKDNIIANIKNEFNCVVFEGKTNGKLAFVGKGAGSYPTASAIVSDLYLIKEKNANDCLDLSKSIQYVKRNEDEYLIYDEQRNVMIKVNNKDELKDKFYIRIFKE